MARSRQGIGRAAVARFLQPHPALEIAFPAALFLHILGALGLAFANGLEFMLVRGLRRGSPDQIVVWADAYRVLPALGGGSLGLILLTGLYMMVIRGAQAWMLVALAALVLIAIVGASSGIRLRNTVRAAARPPAATDMQRALRPVDVPGVQPAAHRTRGRPPFAHGLQARPR